MKNARGRRVIRTLGVAAIVVVAVGCGSGSDSGSDSDSGSAFDREAALESWRARFSNEEALCIVDKLEAYYGSGGSGDPRDQYIEECVAEEPETTEEEESSPPSSTAPQTDEQSPYYGGGILVTTEEGWIYRMTPSLQVPDFSFSKVVESSPPGKARLVFEVTLPSGFGVQVEGATPGRTPPDTWPGSIRATWPLDARPGSLRDVSSDLQTCVDLSCWLMAYDLFDGQPFYRTGPAVSGDLDESTVDDVVDSANDLEPVLVVEAFGCDFVFSPDGRVADGGEFGRDSCSKATFELEDASGTPEEEPEPTQPEGNFTVGEIESILGADISGEMDTAKCGSVSFPMGVFVFASTSSRSAYVFDSTEDAAWYLDAQEETFANASSQDVECFGNDGRLVKTISAGASGERVDEYTLVTSGTVVFEAGGTADFGGFVERVCGNVVLGAPETEMEEFVRAVGC